MVQTDGDKPPHQGGTWQEFFERMFLMKIDSHELRKEINKLHSEMGWISKDEVKKVIDKLERESYEQSEVCAIVDKL